MMTVSRPRWRWPLVGLIVAIGMSVGGSQPPGRHALARPCAGGAVPAASPAATPAPGEVDHAASGATMPRPAAPAVARTGDGNLLIRLTGGDAVVEPASLEITARPRGGRPFTLSGPAAIGAGGHGGGLGRPREVRIRGGAGRWSYPRRGLEVAVRPDRGRLSITVRATVDTTLTWPVTGVDQSARDAAAIQLPRGEGLSIPAGDPWWNSTGLRVAGARSELVGGLTMPFWGHTIGDRGASYLVPDGIGTAVRLVSDRGRLHVEAEHAFSARGGTRTYALALALTGPAPTAAALDYRHWLVEHGRLGSLRAKIAANPAVGRLLGAFHAYLWGTARGADSMARLRRLGIDCMWLGYATDEPMSARAVAAARAAGYLVSPYDSWDNAQDPRRADTRTSVWPGRLYPDGCIRTKDGTVLPGFHDRGCYLSAAALAEAEPAAGHLARRVDAMTRNGVDSYFLDVDAAGEFFDDYSAAHPMTRARDRDHRLARMRYVSARRRLVLGSETAGSWANRVLAFSHGSSTPAADRLWPLQRDRRRWGAYWPPDAPRIVFKPVHLPGELATAMFHPAYRVPLYETVLHDSVISLDRWELSYYKLPDQQVTRVLLAMLYNTPLNFAFDADTLPAHGAEVAALQRFFAPLHRAAGTEPMTDFRWLSADRRVQRTSFGAGTLNVVANFGTRAYRGLPGGCVDAALRGDPRPRRLCPDPPE